MVQELKYKTLTNIIHTNFAELFQMCRNPGRFIFTSVRDFNGLLQARIHCILQVIIPSYRHCRAIRFLYAIVTKFIIAAEPDKRCYLTAFKVAFYRASCIIRRGCIEIGDTANIYFIFQCGRPTPPVLQARRATSPSRRRPAPRRPAGKGQTTPTSGQSQDRAQSRTSLPVLQRLLMFTNRFGSLGG